MHDALDSALTAALYKVLATNPNVDLERAIDLVVENSPSISSLGVRRKQLAARLTAHATRFRRQGVLNPAWLEHHELHAHFWLLNAHPGFVEHLVTQANEQRTGISQHVLYGLWDSLVILRGTDADANSFQSTLSPAAYAAIQRFSASHTLLMYGYEASVMSRAATRADRNHANSAVLDFDSDAAQQREDLTRRGVLLGPAWVPVDHGGGRVTAFIGITIEGKISAGGMETLRELRANPTVRGSLVHFWELREGRPWHFLAKVVCDGMDELDAVTTAMGNMQVGPAKLGAATYVVARGTDHAPVFQIAIADARVVAPDLRELSALTHDVIQPLGPEAIAQFNRLTGTDALGTLTAIAQVRRAIDAHSWTVDMQSVVEAAFHTFALAAVEGQPAEALRSAVTGVAIAVEGKLQRELSQMCKRFFAGDRKVVQAALRLPTVKFDRVTLGKLFHAFEEASREPRTAELAVPLHEDHLRRLQAFSEARNRWLHPAPEASRDEDLEHAGRTVADGIALLAWIGGVLGPALSNGS